MINVGNDRINARLRVTAPTLYHYTSMDVLPVFFNEGADLYCTNSKCLNDPTELYFGALSFAEYLEHRKVIDIQHANLLKLNIHESIKQDWFDSWIMSFSAAKDDLSQWRGYVASAKGGYSIGFNTSKLVRALANLTKQEQLTRINKIPILTRCWYSGRDREAILDLFEHLFMKYQADFKHYQAESPVTPEVVRSVLATIFPMTMQIKHEAFYSEHESRIIVTVPGCDYSKVVILGGKPRMPVGLPLLGDQLWSYIDEIYLSPHGNTNTLLTQVEWLKRKHGAGFAIIKSEIPYDPSR